jgi:hypothetical protein
MTTAPAAAAIEPDISPKEWEHIRRLYEITQRWIAWKASGASTEITIDTDRDKTIHPSPAAVSPAGTSDEQNRRT